MDHHFNIEIAQNHGVNVAIFLNNIAFWMQKNAANKRHFREGRFWTYSSQEGFKGTFPYWTRQNIRTIINYCSKNNLVMIGNFNETTYDRTTWYSLSDDALDLFPPLKKLICENAIGWNQPIDLLKSTNRKVATNQPIPYIKPYNKPNRAIATSVDKSKPNKPSRSKSVKRKSSSVCLTTIPDDFLPDEYGTLKLYEVASKTHNSIHALRDKFIEVSKNYKTKSDNWQKSFIEFLERERPARVYEDAKGKRQRYDGKSLY